MPAKRQANRAGYGFVAIMIILLIALVAAMLLVPAQPINIYNNNQEVANRLDVSGSATVRADPDKIEIVVGADTKDLDAAVSQQANARIMNAVRNALYAKGLAASDLETTQYYVTPITEYNKTTGQYDQAGYETIQMIRIKSTNIDKAGEYIDVAVSAGANRVDSISFTLTDEKQVQLKNDALKKAGTNAHDKAASIASGLGLSVGKVVRSSESSLYYYPNIRSAQESISSGTAPIPTQISPGQIEITATISVTYETI